MKFAIVDIETTGLYHQGHGITEIAVLHSDGQRHEMVFHALLNPGKSIPSGITHLTGISDQTVFDAPDFESIANELAEALKGRIFVAHNVNFDYNFLKAAFENLTMPFKYQRLCTMRYSRKLLKESKSHKLKSVCLALNIENTDEHRAGGDAFAAAEILRRLIERDDSNILESLLKQNRGHAILPPQIEEGIVNELPNNAGVYYFYGADTKPIYIGKAKNLKRRVLSHFTASGSTGKKQIFQREITRIEYREAANEYEAQLHEDAEIKKYWPVYNTAQKNRVAAFAVIPYEDRVGKTRFGIVKSKDRSDAIGWFNSQHQAKIWLYRALIDNEINPERAGMYRSEDLDYKENETDDNIDVFIKEKKAELNNSYLLVENSKDKNQFGVAVIDGKYRGYGHFDSTHIDLTIIDSVIAKAPDSPAAKAVIRKMLNDDKIEKIEL